MTTFTHDFHLRFYEFSRFEWLLWQEAGHCVKLLVLGKQTVDAGHLTSIADSSNIAKDKLNCVIDVVVKVAGPFYCLLHKQLDLGFSADVHLRSWKHPCQTQL